MKSLTFTRGALLSAALMLVPGSPALAAGGESTPLHISGDGLVTHTTSSGGSGILRTIFGLLIVIAAIYGLAWILRRAKGGRTRTSGQGLTQLASLPLAGGRSVALVRAGQEVHLLGIAEHSVTPLRVYSEAEARAAGIELPPDDVIATEVVQPPVARVTDTLRRLTVRS